MATETGKIRRFHREKRSGANAEGAAIMDVVSSEPAANVEGAGAVAGHVRVLRNVGLNAPEGRLPPEIPGMSGSQPGRQEHRHPPLRRRHGYAIKDAPMKKGLAQAESPLERKRNTADVVEKSYINA
jgi:hypothetical protein